MRGEEEEEEEDAASSLVAVAREPASPQEVHRVSLAEAQQLEPEVGGVQTFRPLSVKHFKLSVK